jgi:hypothetical protein
MLCFAHLVQQIVSSVSLFSALCFMTPQMKRKQTENGRAEARLAHFTPLCLIRIANFEYLLRSLIILLSFGSYLDASASASAFPPLAAEPPHTTAENKFSFCSIYANPLRDLMLSTQNKTFSFHDVNFALIRIISKVYETEKQFIYTFALFYIYYQLLLKPSSFTAE